MIAIDNSALISGTSGIGIPPINIALFVPGATWTYSGGNITVTDTTVITSPDTFVKANIAITDNEGVTVYGHISSAAGNTGAISVASMATAGPLTIQITSASGLGVQCSGQSSFVTISITSGTIGFWEVTPSTAL